MFLVSPTGLQVKCDYYLPTTIKESFSVKGYHVSILEEALFQNFVVRKLNLQNDKVCFALFQTNPVTLDETPFPVLSYLLVSSVSFWGSFCADSCTQQRQ